MRFWRLVRSPHLIVCGIQIVVAMLGTVGILGAGRTAALEMGLGAVLVAVTSLGAGAMHAAITRRQADRQVAMALKRVAKQQQASGPQVPPAPPA